MFGRQTAKDFWGRSNFKCHAKYWFFDDTTPIQSGLLNKSLESAQKKVEAFFYDTRKQLFEYDQALNAQRNGVYAERRRIFTEKTLRNWIIEYAEKSIEDVVLRLKDFSATDVPNSLSLKFQNLLGLPFYKDFLKEPEKTKSR